jgi:hypothetical protein
MPLDDVLRRELTEAIKAYDFPRVTYDFRNSIERQHDSMRGVEECVCGSLLSDDAELVKDGLSNVLYWGYARMGKRWVRVDNFRRGVTTSKLLEAQKLFRQLKGPGLIQIKKLGLPEFGGLSFVSKVRMFLDPVNYVTLDLQLMKLHSQKQPTIFRHISLRPDATTIPITRANERFYERWCCFCRRTAKTYFSDANIRAVEIERAVYNLVSTNRAGVAAEILANAED